MQSHCFNLRLLFATLRVQILATRKHEIARIVLAIVAHQAGARSANDTGS